MRNVALLSRILGSCGRRFRRTRSALSNSEKRVSGLDYVYVSVGSKVQPHHTGRMKRKAVETQTPSKVKRVRESEPDYCDASPQKDDNGSIIWPAPSVSMDSARSFLKEWYGACNLLRDYDFRYLIILKVLPPLAEPSSSQTRMPTGSMLGLSYTAR